MHTYVYTHASTYVVNDGHAARAHVRSRDAHGQGRLGLGEVAALFVG